MNIVLISLQRDIETDGLKYLHASLLHHGYASHLLYLPGFNPDSPAQRESIQKFFRAVDPSLIGISLMSVEFHAASALTRFIKSIPVRAPVVWGGIHPTLSPESCLPFADYVCVGEGERSIVDIARALGEGKSLEGVPNLCYLRDGALVRNALHPLIEDLDGIPRYEHIPRRSFILSRGAVVPLSKKVFRRYARYCGKTYSIITTRGCPFACAYCCNNFLSRLYHTRAIRRRSVENILGEIEVALRDNPEIEYINFQDDCFLACSDAYLRQFCEMYKKRMGAPFIIRAIPVYIRRDRLELLKDAGVAWVSLGLQSGSDRVCREVFRRGAYRDDFLRAARCIHDLKIAANYDVILDNPFETIEDQRETIRTLIQTPKPFHGEFFSLTFYFGTELYERAKAECPALIEDCLTKNYLIPHRSVVNRLTILSAFLDEGRMNGLMRLFAANADGVRFRLYLAYCTALAACLVQPISYFEVIRRSQRGSFVRTFRVLSIYLKQGLHRHIYQFGGAVKRHTRSLLGSITHAGTD